MLVQDCINGTKTIIAENEEWDCADDGKPDPDDENSDQEFPSTDGSDSESSDTRY